MYQTAGILRLEKHFSRPKFLSRLRHYHRPPLVMQAVGRLSLNKVMKGNNMSALDQILSIPSIKSEHPRLHSEAVRELEELRKAAQQERAADWRESASA